jgi:hypothetical protein
MPKPNKFEVPHDLRWRIGTLADAARVSPHTMADYLTGRRKNRSQATRETIERVLRECGLSAFIRAE